MIVSVKFGALRGPDGSWLGFDGRPAAVKELFVAQFDAAGVEPCWHLQTRRLDGSVPIEETVGAVAEMVTAGYVRYVGLLGGWGRDGTAGEDRGSDMRCRSSMELASRGLNRQFCLGCEDGGGGDGVRGPVPWAAKWVGAAEEGRLPEALPWFTRNLETNQRLVKALHELAAESVEYPAVQMAIAWVLAQGRISFR